jgi:hypothetical protein
MTKTQTVELLQQQLPGFYSVEQVIKLINDIDDEGGSFDAEKLERLIERVEDEVDSRLNRMDSSDLVDFGSAEFELNGNEISLQCVEVDASNIVEEVSDVVRNVLADFFPAPSE